MGEVTVSGLMFANNLVGIWETPEERQKQLKEAPETPRKRGLGRTSRSALYRSGV